MITNYYTLVHMAAELEREFAGQTMNEIFTQHRGELVISFTETPAAIVVGCEPANNFIFARKTFARARRNSINFFTDIHGTVIDKIIIHPTDRQLHIHLNDQHELVVQLFGSKANVLLLDAKGAIVETFLKKSDVKVTELEPFHAKSSAHATESFIATYAHQSLTTALKHELPLFGLVLIKELLSRANQNGDQLVDTLPPQDISQLLDHVKRMKEELLGVPSPRVYFDGPSPVRFSIIPLHHLRWFMVQNYPSVSEGIQTYLAHGRRENSILQEKEHIVQVLDHERERTERTLHKILEEAEKSNRAEQYELFGKLLIAQLHVLKKGESMAVVENFIDGSNELIEIPLDPHLTPAKNAERYFEKAKKSRHAQVEQTHRKTELTHRQQSIAHLLLQLVEITTIDDIQQFEEEHQSVLLQFGLNSKKSGPLKKEEAPPFRKFSVAGGYQVWAGKSSENNDLLSTRHTAKNDLWFHVRGVGGSHVVLKIGTGKGEVSKQAIEQAAAIAAYYSKMKKSKLVPVTMCEGKYVRKPKGAPAGTVTVEREKTIYAEPRLPSE